MPALLEIRGLSAGLQGRRSVTQVVSNVDLDVQAWRDPRHRWRIRLRQEHAWRPPSCDC